MSDGGARRPDSDAEAAAQIAVGRVGRAHGLDGSFYVTRALSRLLQQATVLYLDGRAVEVVRRAGTAERPIVRVQGVADRAAAQALRGTQLTVPRDAAPALGEDEWWAHELEGCVVADGARTLGTVSRLIELPSCEALEVAPAGGGEPLLVPLVKDAVRAVSPKDGRIEVDSSFLGLDEGCPPDAGGAGP